MLKKIIEILSLFIVSPIYFYAYAREKLTECNFLYTKIHQNGTEIG